MQYEAKRGPIAPPPTKDPGIIECYCQRLRRWMSLYEYQMTRTVKEIVGEEGMREWQRMRLQPAAAPVEAKGKPAARKPVSRARKADEGDSYGTAGDQFRLVG